MNALGILNELLVNLALLIAGVTVITLTSQGHETRESAVRLLLRYSSAVLLALFLMTHRVELAPGLLFDFRGVVIALAARRYGLVAGLLVALPVALYRLSLGGAGAWPGVATLLLVALLAGAGTGLARPNPPLSGGHRRPPGLDRPGHLWDRLSSILSGLLPGG